MATFLDSTSAPARPPSPFTLQPAPQTAIPETADHLLHEIARQEASCRTSDPHRDAGRFVGEWWAERRDNLPTPAAALAIPGEMRRQLWGWAREDREDGDDALWTMCDAHVRAAILAAYAAPIAAARYRGTDGAQDGVGCCLADLDELGEADRVAADWYMDGPAAIAACDRCEAEAADLVRSPKGWAAICAVAAAMRSRGDVDRAGIAALCAQHFPRQAARAA